MTVNGKQEAGTEISLSADNQNNRKKEYTIIAEDRRGNSTSCKITINPCSDLQKRISHLSVDTVKVTDRALVQNTLKDAVTAVENAAEEEKTILAEVKTKCETLLAKIDEMTQPQDYIRGDVDANSKVDVGDVRTALRYICKKDQFDGNTDESRRCDRRRKSNDRRLKKDLKICMQENNRVIK